MADNFVFCDRYKVFILIQKYCILLLRDSVVLCSLPTGLMQMVYLRTTYSVVYSTVLTPEPIVTSVLCYVRA